MKGKLISLLIFAIICSSSYKTGRKRVFIAGDSTAQSYNIDKTLMRGWGQLLHVFFTDDIKIVNHAIGGRSTKTFINEGRWDKLIKQAQNGDYVIIQFGHNDASSVPERHTGYSDYEANLIKFIEDAKSIGVQPILATSVVMRTFINGHLIDDRLKGYPAITRKVAKEFNVPLIDVNTNTRDFVTMLGDEASKPYYRWLEPGIDPSKPEGVQDDTHMNELGAKQVAQFVADGIKNLNLEGISEHVKNNF